MARPIKEGLDYFPHDTDTITDERIEAIRAIHGNDGYAFYFILLERIYQTADGELDISLPTMKAVYIKRTMLSNEKFNEILSTALELGLFNSQYYRDTGRLTSSGIKKRFGVVQEMREKWRKRKENGITSVVISGENPIDNSDKENPEETRQRKEKEIKEKKKESKGKEREVQKGKPDPSDDYFITMATEYFKDKLNNCTESEREAIIAGQANILKMKHQVKENEPEHVIN